jgi:uncharacterized protein
MPYDHDRSAEEPRRAAGPLCPICKASVVERHKPFCSKRCADIDLHRWLAGVYAVPTNEKPEEDEEKEKK